ncbi:MULTISPECIES: YdiK family protein [Geobacillus]|uniref:DUF4305 domain-containing protein n=1 Tax=Geobacillus thermocatenulatus TaxID=33938 RepID=A0A226Q618_9BACL|nr:MULTISPECIES: YdiK family protein [Geobacillus]KPC98179.1 hypothetical protein LR69_03590 [Geobacillus sp. BCO2]RAN30555.1 hypothetical protein VC88_02165 [Geobacillus sp. A8]ASS97632.1 DUF4305 domain-containing protein [Geobacillus thermocatenulatus]AST00762.1 DUF4305 domain-containing protein [Geobacillus thermocatenulatus]KLR75000.1 hypothetical protein ABH20_02660 [Geobacillus sp. T6]
MTRHPRLFSLPYFILGFLFTYLAIESVHETIWNVSTIALAALAAFDFGTALRLLFASKR